MSGNMPTRDALRIFDKFSGINNAVKDSKHIASTELQVGKNIDLDNYGKPRRKKGYQIWKAGKYRWGWSDGDLCLAVRDTFLVQLLPDASEVVLRSRIDPDSRMVFERVLDRIYYTNGAIIGYIQNFSDNTLSATGQFKATLPPGEFLAYQGSRLFVARGNVLAFSDPGWPDQMDLRFNYRQLKDPFTLLEAVGDGLFFADGSQTYFWKTEGKDLLAIENDIITILSDYGAIPHATTTVDGKLVAGDKTIPGKVKFWATPKGICAGSDGGQFENLTLGKYEVQNGYSGAGFWRNNWQGVSQAIFTINR